MNKTEGRNELVRDKESVTNASFRSAYVPVIGFIVGMLGICLLGSNVQENKAAAAKVPDVVNTYHNCEYLGKDYVMVGGSVWTYLSTSCGRFEQPLKKFDLEKGKTYEIETTRSATKGSYISDVTPSQ
jgi:hypothetical protein